MTLEWSERALADLNRFVEFLERHHPRLSTVVTDEIALKATMLVLRLFHARESRGP